MSPKTKKAPAKEEKKASSAKAEKADKVEKKAGGKAAAKAEAAAPANQPAEGVPGVDPEELEEEAEEAAARSSGGGGEAAALAAAGSSEMSASFKNFRHHPDMENFYRFIFENDLRHEALAIIDQIMVEKKDRRAAAGKSAGKSAHA